MHIEQTLRDNLPKAVNNSAGHAGEIVIDDLGEIRISAQGIRYQEK
jgi:hypothetical protein